LTSRFAGTETARCPHQRKLTQVIKKSGLGGQIAIILALFVRASYKHCQLRAHMPLAQAILIILSVVAFN
jgi:hypothetical protein